MTAAAAPAVTCESEVMRRIGAIFLPQFPPEHLRPVVEAAEVGGVPELWLWEDCFQESAFASAAAALAWSERLRVGIGVAPMPLRNVAITAMEIATIDRTFPGRLQPRCRARRAALDGAGRQQGRSPLTLMREYVPALRQLLAGDEVTTSGRFVQLDRVQLAWPPAPWCRPCTPRARGRRPCTSPARSPTARC